MSTQARNLGGTGARRYELLLEIGTGGMGKVYLGRAVGMGGFERYVAIKCCHAHLTKDQEFAAMFLDEARIAARIHHPNVVPTLDVGEADVLYLVMEYVEGERLSEVITAARERGAPIPLATALKIAVDALAGLHAAHGLRDASGALLDVVHRDVTPQNVMVGVDGVARILDFGIATAASRSTTTKEGHVKGKLGYMPPEQLSAGESSPRTDLYALAVVLWEALAGRRLFRGKTDAETMALALRGEVPRLSELRADVPVAVDAAIRKALAREPDDRYASAAEFADALEQAGAPLASARAVGAYVTELFGPMLEERRAALRAATEAPPKAVLGSTPPPAAARADSAERPPRRARSLWIVAVVAVALLATGWWLLGAPAPSGDTGASRPAPGEALEVGAGTVEPLGQVAPSAPVAGAPAQDGGPAVDGGVKDGGNSSPDSRRPRERRRAKARSRTPKPADWQPTHL